MKQLISDPCPQLHVFALIAGVSMFVLAVWVLTVGWALDVSAVRRPLADFAAMEPNSAVAIAALGLALALSQFTGPVRQLSAVLTAVAAAIGGITVVEYAFDWNTGIHQLLFLEPNTPPGASSGRPAVLTAIALVLLSVGMTGSGSRGWQHVMTICSLLGLLVSWMLLNGYLFAYSSPPGMRPFGAVSVHTAGALFLIALGAVASQPGSWPVSTLVANNVGGTVCRWLLPAAILTPPVLGWIVRHLAAFGEAGAAFHWALYSVISSVGSVSLILFLARRIEVLDAERAAATVMSRHDELTRLPNRRAFDSFLSEAFNRARRYERPLSLLTIDVDEFKSYNDTFGHPAGDEVLRAIAATFADVARDTDLVARIGGEEFAMVLPETAVAGARTLAERVRQQVTEIRFRRPVTVSIGVATVSTVTPTAGLLLQQSDAALYAAKRGGRNRVVVWRAPAPSVVMP